MFAENCIATRQHGTYCTHMYPSRCTNARKLVTSPLWPAAAGPAQAGAHLLQFSLPFNMSFSPPDQIIPPLCTPRQIFNAPKYFAIGDKIASTPLLLDSTDAVPTCARALLERYWLIVCIDTERVGNVLLNKSSAQQSKTHVSYIFSYSLGTSPLFNFDNLIQRSWQFPGGVSDWWWCVHYY